ncbi:MAG: hypothetical protein KY462_00285 [Actinobacteria bacterium]|nr:hypothetical protein [Actinomycetota bacterium]
MSSPDRVADQSVTGATLPAGDGSVGFGGAAFFTWLWCARRVARAGDVALW